MTKAKHIGRARRVRNSLNYRLKFPRWRVKSGPRFEGRFLPRHGKRNIFYRESVWRLSLRMLGL